VLLVFKHFPGHGRVVGDSHRRAVTTPPLTELRDVDLLPYRQLLDSQPAAVMVGHLDVPGLTKPDTSASISPAALALLLKQLRFDGMVFIDDLIGMAAITNRIDLPEAVRRSLTAGVDMALWVTTDRFVEVLDHLEQAVAKGSLPESRVNQGVAHTLRAKAVDLCSRITELPSGAVFITGDLSLEASQSVILRVLAPSSQLTSTHPKIHKMSSDHSIEPHGAKYCTATTCSPSNASQWYANGPAAKIPPIPTRSRSLVRRPGRNSSLVSNPRRAMFTILDPDRNAMPMVDPLTDSPVAVPTDEGERIWTSA
jgi:hypothetical protein